MFLGPIYLRIVFGEKLKDKNLGGIEFGLCSLLIILWLVSLVLLIPSIVEHGESMGYVIAAAVVLSLVVIVGGIAAHNEAFQDVPQKTSLDVSQKSSREGVCYRFTSTLVECGIAGSKYNVDLYLSPEEEQHLNELSATGAAFEASQSVSAIRSRLVSKLQARQGSNFGGAACTNTSWKKRYPNSGK